MIRGNFFSANQDVRTAPDLTNESGECRDIVRHLRFLLAVARQSCAGSPLVGTSRIGHRGEGGTLGPCRIGDRGEGDLWDPAEWEIEGKGDLWDPAE